MVVGLLFGPVGVALAILEVLSDVPEGSRILEAGLTGKGEVSITARADPLVSERLAAIGRVHWWGNDQVPVFGPGRLTTTSRSPVGTELRDATPAASVDG